MTSSHPSQTLASQLPGGSRRSPWSGGGPSWVCGEPIDEDHLEPLLRRIVTGAALWMIVPGWVGMTFIAAMMKAGCRDCILLNPHTLSALQLVDVMDAHRWVLWYAGIAFATVGGVGNASAIPPSFAWPLWMVLSLPMIAISLPLVDLGGTVLGG